MTREQKDLLIKDLYARLPYGVKCAYFDGMGNESEDILNAIFPNDERLLVGKCSIDYSDSDILGVIPYLFPISSMTLELRCKIQNLLPNNCDISFKNQRITFYNEGIIQLEQLEKIFNLFNLHHIDYRGLIPMGLSIDETGKNIY